MFCPVIRTDTTRATNDHSVPEMKILVHDYCGHAFPIQLSRNLARRGHRVLHLYSPSVSSPRGPMELRHEDPDSLEIEPISLNREFEKYKVPVRLLQEIKYGRLVAERVRQFSPDVVISGNTPLLSQRAILIASRKSNSAFVFWLQDLIGVAADRIMKRRGSVFGVSAAKMFVALEKHLLRTSDGIVTISEDFQSLLLNRYSLPPHRVSVIENWAALEEIPVCATDNDWSKRHRLSGHQVLLYAGTMGMKHNPELILRLAIAASTRPNVLVVVASEGLGAEWLEEQKEACHLENLILIGWQDYQDLPSLLGSADVLTVILESDAGTFSVPSKMLAYLCAGRPLLAALPPENLAARIVERSGAGLSVASEDIDGYVEAGLYLLDNPEVRAKFGTAGRRFAESMFNIDTITSKFEDALESATNVHSLK